MKVLLATGIYAPSIGGPATYVRELASLLHENGHDVSVVTYGTAEDNANWPVYSVRKWGGPILRWLRYARALKKLGKDADIVYAFSSVSCGVPLFFSRLKKPKKVLRLGGDFFWERVTDRGYRGGLYEWYMSHPILVRLMQLILSQFDSIVFSTRYQQRMYEEFYREIPSSIVIENALPKMKQHAHEKHDPFRLLFMGRFVSFKNLHSLLQALVKLPGVRLTLIGSGPLEKSLRAKSKELLIDQRVTFLEAVQREEKEDILKDYDMLVLPSLTEISPNMALEARSSGLPVLLTQETGLSPSLTQGMTLAPLRTPIDIVRAIADSITHYETIASSACELLPERTWEMLLSEHLALFSKL